MAREGIIVTPLSYLDRITAYDLLGALFPEIIRLFGFPTFLLPMVN